MNLLLGSIANSVQFLSTNVVHPTYFPYLWAPTLHAARISLVYQTLARKSGLGTYSKFPWGPYLAGYLISCWAGGIITSFLLGMPPPMAYSFHPWINYLSVHLALTALFTFFPFLLVPKFFDTLLFPIDGLLRAISVTGTIGLLDNPNVPPAFKAMNTPFGHLLLGALASASGGISMATFSLSTPTWHLNTPPILTAGLWSSADVWGGALAALLYGAVTHNPVFTLPTTDPAYLGSAFFPLNLLPQSLLQLLFVSPSPRSSFNVLAISPKVPTLTGKAMAALALMLIFSSRALYTHWLVGPAAGQKVHPAALAAAAAKRAGGSKVKAR